jgi:stage V sporulation protein S
MDRFFSKLDLRDIKIEPDSKFPPEEDGYSSIDDSVAEFQDGATETVSAVATEPVATKVEEVEVVEEVAEVAKAEHGEVLKVSARSRPSAVAGAIAGVVRESGRAEVQAIGAGATNQAVKAVAIARDYLEETGIDSVCLPAFIDVTIDNEDRTAIRLIVEPR